MEDCCIQSHAHTHTWAVVKDECWLRFRSNLDISEICLQLSEIFIPRLHDTTGCQPAVSCKQTSNRLSNQLSATVRSTRLSNRVVQPVWQPAVYTIQPVVKPVVNRFDNRLYCVNGGFRDSRLEVYIRPFQQASKSLLAFCAAELDPEAVAQSVDGWLKGF